VGRHRDAGGRKCDRTGLLRWRLPLQRSRRTAQYDAVLGGRHLVIRYLQQLPQLPAEQWSARRPPWWIFLLGLPPRGEQLDPYRRFGDVEPAAEHWDLRWWAGQLHGLVPRREPQQRVLVGSGQTPFAAVYPSTPHCEWLDATEECCRVEA
jgi:hypothetical protein